MNGLSGKDSLYYSVIPSPVGLLRLVASTTGLRALEWEKGRHSLYEDTSLLLHDDSYSVLVDAGMQLNEYFSGKRAAFSVPLDIKGSVFQINAWRQLQQIPYGATITYGEQARRMGDNKKARAVGMANGRNPLSIIIPCHRVIGATGALTGFGGGLATKQFLLELEQNHVRSAA